MKVIIIFFLIIAKVFDSVSFHSPEQYRLDEAARQYQKERDFKVYQPLNLYLDSSSSPNPDSGKFKSHKTPSSLPGIKEFKKILHMSQQIPSWVSMFSQLNELLSNMWFESPFILSKKRLSPSVFMKDKQFETTINTVVTILEHHSLEPKERLWLLTVLKHLQDYLPNGELIPIIVDMNEGPISHTALQLHLTKGR